MYKLLPIVFFLDVCSICFIYKKFKLIYIKCTNHVGGARYKSVLVTSLIPVLTQTHRLTTRGEETNEVIVMTVDIAY